MYVMFGLIGLAISAAGLPLAGVSVPTSAESSAISATGMSQSTTASQQPTSGDDAQGPRDAADPYLQKFYLFACPVQDQSDGGGPGEVDGLQVFLLDGKLTLGQPAEKDGPDGHPFHGFFVEYPFRVKKGEPAPRGLVSTISFDPPNLNWIYIDRSDGSLRYGNKTASLPHITDPWGFRPKDGRLLELHGDSVGFIAVRDRLTCRWGLHYDINDDLLESFASCKHKYRIEVDLERRLC